MKQLFICMSDNIEIAVPWGFPGGSGNPPAKQEMQVQPLGWGNPLEKKMATHSSILAWKIPRTVEPGRLYSPWVANKSDTT